MGDDAGIKERMRKRLARPGFSARKLARKLGMESTQVQRYTGGKETVPAWFIAEFIRRVPTDPEWLLTGEGSPDPIAPDEAARCLDDIEARIRQARKRVVPNAEPGTLVKDVPTDTTK